jgi:hypothetical protein
MNSLSICYEERKEVTKDFQAAVFLYKKRLHSEICKQSTILLFVLNMKKKLKKILQQKSNYMNKQQILKVHKQ